MHCYSRLYRNLCRFFVVVGFLQPLIFWKPAMNYETIDKIYDTVVFDTSPGTRKLWKEYFRGSVKIGDDLDMSSLNTDLIR